MGLNAVTGLTRANYSGLDFDTHSDDLRSRIQSQFGAIYNDFAVSSLGIMLLDVVAYGLDTLSFYLDRRATDVYLDTARTRKSVSRICRQLGYRMRGAVASAVDLDVIPVADTPSSLSPFVIQKGFQFLGPNNLRFETAQDTTYVYSGGWSSQSIPCYEGVTLVEPFVSDGTLNQVFELKRVPSGMMIADGSVKVTVGGADWTESEFITFDATDQFETGLNDDPPTVRFGDGVAGNIPAPGAEIRVTYVATTGLGGQATKNTITDVVTPLVVSFTTVNLEVDNALGASGGDDLETLAHAKIYAARVWKSRHVAITQPDYEALSGSYADPLFGKVAVAQAISSRSADTDLVLINLISAIKNAVLSFVTPVRAACSSAETELTTVSDALTEMSTLLSSVASAVTNIDSSSTSIITTGRTSKNKTGSITVDVADIQSTVVSGKAEIDAITSGGSDTLTTSMKNTLKAYFDRVAAEAVSINDANVFVSGYLENMIGFGGDISDKVAEIGTSLIVDGYVKDLNTQRGIVATAQAVIVGDVNTIQEECDNVDTTSGYSSEVNAYLDDIYNHVDAILSADCKANLVVVPILTKNSGGFYQSPSVGLIDSLQTFLDQRKEVTQTVAVTSGGGFLVYADIVVRLAVLRNYSQTVTASAVGTVIDGILKDRKFGDSLYVSYIYTTVMAQVVGIGFLNVTITGPATYLDSDGNLIISKSYIITKGTVTVTPEVVETV